MAQNQRVRAGRVRPQSRPGRCAFTLLEVLLTLALFALLAASAAPLLLDALQPSLSGDATEVIEEAVLDAHTAAVDHGQRRVLQLTGNGLQPGRRLPEGWTLEVRRFTESRFRRPRHGEIWEFNSVGICEPLALRIGDGNQIVELHFDPLTAQILDH